MAFERTEPMGLDMNKRASDPPIKITREIPLPWVLSVIAAIIGQAAMVWFAQQQQGEQLRLQTDTIKALTAELRGVTSDLQNGRTKDVEHDLTLKDHERRLMVLEKAR